MAAIFRLRNMPDRPNNPLKTSLYYFAAYWLMPVLLAAGAFRLLIPYVSTLVVSPSAMPFSFYLAAGGQVPVTIKNLDGNQHIFYEAGQVECTTRYHYWILPYSSCAKRGLEEIRVTKNQLTNADPVTDGKFIAWITELRGGWQINLHYIPTNQTLPLSLSGNNVGVTLANPYLAWESIHGNKRTVMVFNGSYIKQMTNQATSINPSVTEDGRLLFARRNDFTSDWQSISHDLKTGEQQTLRAGDDAKYPRFENNEVAFGYIPPAAGQVAGAMNPKSTSEKAVVNRSATYQNLSPLNNPPRVDQNAISAEINSSYVAD